VKKWLNIVTLAILLAAGNLFVAANPAAAEVLSPSTVTLLSGQTTQTAGFTQIDPSLNGEVISSGTETLAAGPFSSAPLLPIDADAYAWAAAPVVTVHSAWTTIPGAQWVSTTSGNYGVETANEGDTWRLFKATFDVPSGLTSADIRVAGDNAFEFYVNNNLAASTADLSPSAPVYGAWPGGGSQAPFNVSHSYNLDLTEGENTILFVLRNWNNNGSSNPSALIYQITLSYGSADPLEPGAYSGGGTWSLAPSFNKYSSWTSLPEARWVSTTSSNYGVETAGEGDTWRLFKDTFNIPDDAQNIQATVEIAGDNAYEFYLNGTLVATTADFSTPAPVYGAWPGNGSQAPFTGIAHFDINPVTGDNNLMFVLRNWDNNASSNPSGLTYRVTLNYDLPTVLPAQVWYLNSVGNPEMEKETGIQTGSETLEDTPMIWTSDEAAASDLTFPNGSWTAVFTTTNWGAGNCRVQIGDFDASTGDFNAFNTTPATGTYSNGRITVIVSTGGTVLQGHYLGLSVVNASGSPQSIATDGSSYLAPPAGSPDYPLPEMSAGILLGMGLLAVSGFVAVKKRKRIVKD
jgi:hypothetical protein